MSDDLSIFPRHGNADTSSQLSSLPNVAPTLERLPTNPNLFPCPDCTHSCSRNAEACPQCGRFFQRFYTGKIFVDRSGWSMTIAWGVILAWLLPLILAVVTIIVLMVLGVAIGSSGSTRQPIFIPNERRP